MYIQLSTLRALVVLPMQAESCARLEATGAAVICRQAPAFRTGAAGSKVHYTSEHVAGLLREVRQSSAEHVWLQYKHLVKASRSTSCFRCADTNVPSFKLTSIQYARTIHMCEYAAFLMHVLPCRMV